jgi:hypothetical protein
MASILRPLGPLTEEGFLAGQYGTSMGANAVLGANEKERA